MELQVKIFLPNFDKPALNRDLNYCLVNHSEIAIEVDANNTVEDIIIKCAKKCNIPPLYVPLFAMRDVATGFWLLPCELAKNVKKKQFELELRIRFTFKSEANVKDEKETDEANRHCTANEPPKDIMCEVVTKYYFFQQRDDFLNGKIQLNAGPNEDRVEVALGVGILDMLRLSKQLSTNSKAKSKIQYHRLLPRSYRTEIQKMNWFQRYRVQKQFFHYLKHIRCNNDNNSKRPLERYPEFSENHIYKMYLRNLEQVTNHQSQKERYEDDRGRSIEVSADNGIVISDPYNASPGKWCDISEIADMNIEVKAIINSGNLDPDTIYTLIISKLNGEVIEITLKSQLAQNLATCIDGYYRLIVNPYHYLCKDIAPPSVMRYEQLNSFGPISTAEACEILKAKSSMTPQDSKVREALIRCSVQRYDEYFINAYFSGENNLDFRNYKVERNIDGKYGIYGSQIIGFDSLEDLLHSLKIRGNLPFDVNNLIKPDNIIKTSMFVRRCDNESLLPKEEGHPFNRVMNTDYYYVDFLGQGKFTDSNVYKSNKDDTKVVFRNITIISDNDFGDVEYIRNSFNDSINEMISCKHNHIIKFIATALNGALVEEYAYEKSVIVYMQQHGQKIDWIFKVFWQLAHACNYLEVRQIPHGKIRGRNVLLASDDNNMPHIKLSDAGVKLHRKRQEARNDSLFVIEPVLPAPWLAYEFCYVDGYPAEHKPTIDGDKWSFATTLCEICAIDDITPVNPYSLDIQMKQNYKSKSVTSISEQLSENSGLIELIKQCWDTNRAKRPKFRQILREIGSSLSSGYVSTISVITKKPDVVLPTAYETIAYQDQSLLKMSNLGSGNFGTVDLYLYDRQGNGQVEKLAVKQFNRQSSFLNEFESEFQLMKRIRHKYIVQLKGIAVPSKRIVMEFLKYGSLAEHIRNTSKVPRFGDSDLLRFCVQIAEAMMYLQSKEINIIHRDLALRNILLDKGPNFFLAKVSDFGLSRFLPESDKEEYYYSCGSHGGIPAFWYAPECIKQNHKRYSFKSDVWSYGITVWEMFSCGRKPNYILDRQITTERELCILWGKLREPNFRLAKPDNCSLDVYDLMMSCWKFTPAERNTFESLKESFSALLSKSLF